MGQSESYDASRRRSTFDPQGRFQLRSTSKAPAKIIINKPKLQESKPILRVPHTNVKIMHVDPRERAGVVPSHGYIALQIVPPEEREAAEMAASMDPLTVNSPDANGQSGGSRGSRGKRARDATNGEGDSNRDPAAAVTEDVVDAGMDPEYAALLRKARAEYSEEHHRDVSREVKKWKAAFALENGRAPNKKDIANNPYIFQQYYVEKELEAMKKLIDENEQAEKDAAREAQWMEHSKAASHQQNNLIRDLTDLDVARSEYNAMEYVDLHRDVKRWKLEFRQRTGHAPTKKDVAESPEIYDKYYRVKDLEAMKKLIDDADAMERSVLAKGGNRGGLGLSGQDPLPQGGGGLDDYGGGGAVDAVEYAKTQFDASEYSSLQHEVRQWKVAFKAARGRPPTKRDISEDPEMFAKYYREKELAAMKKLIEDTESTMRRASVIDGFETLERAKQDYDAEEHEILQHEVKAWKVAFKDANGRPPTKRDISQDPDMFAKYYREKELEAMRKLAQEEADAVANGTSRRTSVLGASGRRRSSGRRSSSFIAVPSTSDAHDDTKQQPQYPAAESLLRAEVEQDAISAAGAAEREATVGGAPVGLLFPQPTEMLSFTASSPHGPGNALPAQEVSGEASQPRYAKLAPPPLGGFTAPGQGSSSTGAHEQQHSSSPAASPASASASAVRTQYVCPRGHQAAERVYFFDAALQLDERGAAMAGIAIQGLYDPVAEGNRYAIEEGEIYEMAGIHRPQPTNFDDDADPLATYELQSNVLEALRMAIDAPMSDFATNTQEAAYDGALNGFIEEALMEAQELFEAQRAQDEAFQKTYSVANLAHSKSSRAGMGRRLMSKVKSRVQSSVRLRATTMEERSMSPDVNTSADTAPTADDDEFAGWSHEDMVRERKKLHKQLNQYKNRCIETTGRAPEAFEMAQDPQIRDVFAQYHELKKRTKQGGMEAVVEATAVHGVDGMEENNDAGSAEKVGEPEEVVQHVEEDDPSARRGFNPFAKVLETMNEDATRRQRLLAPLEGSAADGSSVVEEAEMTPDERELDILSKEVKLWKRGFKEREGKNPTRRDIKNDPEFAGKYFRVKELEALLGKAGDEPGAAADGDDEEGSHAASPKKKKKKGKKGHLAVDGDENKLGVPTDDEGYSSRGEASDMSPEHTTNPSAISRRGLQLSRLDEPEDAGFSAAQGQYQLQDDEDERELDATARDSASAATRIDDALNRLHEEEQINRRDLEADEDIGFRMIVSSAVATGMVPVLNASDQHRAPAEEDDEESLSKSIAGFRAFEGGDDAPLTTLSSEPRHQEERQHPAPSPTFIVEDVRREQLPLNDGRTPAPQPVQLGWSFPTDDAATAFAQGTESSNDRAAAADDAEGEEEEPKMSLEEKKERRKAVAKELNQWKAHFKMVNSRAPVAKDIKQHPPVQKLFDEYQLLSKEIEEAEVALKRSVSGKRPEALSRHPSSRAGSPAAVDEDGAPLTPLSAAKHRRTQLAREIANWRAEFKVQEGRPPTLKDIAASEHIAAVYEEYTKLNDFVADREGGGGARGVEDTNETVALALRRKHLARLLNEWKAKFHDTYGRNPGVRDIKTDKQAAMMFEEYNLIPKTVEDDAAVQLERVDRAEENDEGAQLREAKIRKKELNKILNEWKAQFADSMGRKPKVADILSDEIVAAVYSEYQELQAALSDAAAGGGALAGAAPPPAMGGFAPWAAAPTPEPAPPTSEWVAPEHDTTDRGGDQNGNDNESPERAQTPLAKRKKLVTKQLNKWKSDFAANEGRNPTKADIKKDPEAFMLFQQYQQLKEQLSAGGEGGGDEEQQDAPTQHNDESRDGAPANENSAAVVVQNEEHRAAPVEEEASNMPARDPPASSTPAQDGAPASPGMSPNHDGNDEDEDEASRLKSSKRALNKRLNAWKHEFTATNGRAPKQSDIQQDPEMLTLYEELKVIKLQLKSIDAGGGGDD